MDVIEVDPMSMFSYRLSNLDACINSAIRSQIPKKRKEPDNDYYNRCNKAKHDLVELLVEVLPKICADAEERMDTFWMDRR